MVDYKELQVLKKKLPNDMDFAKRIRPLIPISISKRIPNDMDLGIYFRNINIDDIIW
mgnify:CR=1 FL=1|tara:strand:+ start:975 stop:1145 length:171 start_codon:yes stop_codon:yes gene_type:complete